MSNTSRLIPQYQNQSIDDLIQRIEATKKNIIDTDLVRQAYNTAAMNHGNQLRLSGEPYIIHPLAVAYILFDLGMDTETICAGLLHDVIEDTGCSEEDLAKKFGKSIAQLVQGVTKITQMKFNSKEEQQSENVRKMLLAMSDDIRVIIIKLADRLHNMRTMDYQKGKKQLEKSLETMEIYAPIAHRLGIRPIKEELEDLSIRYLDPIAYDEIQNMLKSKTEESEQFVINIQKNILERLAQSQIKAHIEGRVKSVYGIYRKVYAAGKSFDEVFDIFAVRVIVDTETDCYNVFGIIHDMFRPLPNRFKDYISTPKPNGYRSLHTTVIGREAIPFEVQIRTYEMHQTAEYGIAAHWKYKAGLRGKDKLDETIAWVRQMIENQQEDGSEDIIKSIKTDLTVDEVYAFTPKGDVKCLPAGSTVIDFAYAIHSAVGNRMIGAKINKRIVSINTEIQTGQIVEIITTKAAGHGPNRDWLTIAKTSEARSKIRAWFKKERREENIETGKIELEHALQRNNIDIPDDEYETFVENLARRQRYDNAEEFYAAIGYGGIAITKFMPRVKDEYQKAQQEKLAQQQIMQQGTENLRDQMAEHQQNQKKSKTAKKNKSGIEVDGIDNCEVKLARCCNPIPGDDIIGFITRGHGVTVHKSDCTNMTAIENDPEQKARFIKVRWAADVKTNFFGTLDIIAENRIGLLADMAILLSNNRVSIERMDSHNMKNGNANMIVTLSVQDISQLNSIMQQMRKIRGILSVDRSGQA